MHKSDDAIAEFGYAQRLERSLGAFATFAAGVSFISILTGCFQLFYFGYGAGGPAYWWTWPVVFVGQVLVALCFAELAARYPVAGSVYNWAKRLSGPATSWLAGWLLLFAAIATLAGVALALQITLPRIWSGFQLVGDGTGTYDFPVNAVILGSALIVCTTVINAFGVKLMARINSVGVFVELIAAVLLIIALAAQLKQPPTAVFQTNGTGAGQPLGYLGAFLVASLASGFVMFGFDTASSLGEETKDPKRTAPKAILRAVNASFWLGGLILLFGILSVRDLADPRLGSADGGLQFIVLDALGGTVGALFLVAIAVAIAVCALSIHTAAIRTMFAMARDNSLPFGSRLAKVDAKSRTPIVPAIVIGLIGIAVLVVNVRQPQIFTVVTSVAVVLIYLAYLLVTVPLLVKRVRGEWPGDAAPGYFSLGRWGLPVNALAVLWGTLMAVNLVWPRREIYNAAEPYHWYLQWGGVLAVGGVTVVGLAYFWLRARHRFGIVEEHAAAPGGNAGARQEAAEVG